MCLRHLLSARKLDTYSQLPALKTGMKGIQIITSVHQTHPGVEAKGEGKSKMCIEM